jgi:hypothetical protein
VQSGGTTAVSEPNTTDTFTVVLNAQPLTNVVFNVTSGDTTEATVSPAPLTFTNANWNVAQTVTVTAADDFLVDGSVGSTTTVSVNDATSDNAFDPLADQTVSVTTADNDVAGFTLVQSGGTTSVTEGGATDSFTVVLNAQPLTNVVFNVSSDNTAEATVSPATLTFTNANWNIAQTVIVTAADELIVDGNQTSTTTVSVNDATSDNAFDPLADQTVSVTTVDNDVLTISITAPDADADENTAGTGTYRVSRNSVLGNTTVQLAIDASSSAVAADWTQSGATFASRTPGSTGTASITAGNTFVDITLTPSADLHAEAAETAQLNVVADAAYTVGSPANATVTIGQNDFVVINTNDGGEGTLRQAVLNANALGGNPTITFDATAFATSQTITLTSDQIVVNNPLTVQGTGAQLLTLNGNATNRIFNINGEIIVTLNDFTATNGATTSWGGAINLVNGPTVTLQRCVVSNSTSQTQGGGIYLNRGTLNLLNSTVSGNTSTTIGGGGIATGTSIVNATVNLVNSTVSGNTGANGGAMLFGSNAVVSLLNTTVTNNTTTQGPNVESGGGAVTVANSLIAANQINTGHADVGGAFTSNGGNLIGDGGSATGFTHGANNDQVGNGAVRINPLLGPLANNGGPTPTHALLAGSPAINAGITANIPGGVTTDQRGTGFTRAIGTVDIGAFEVQKSVSIVADAVSAKEGSPSGNTAFTFTVSRLGDTSGSVTLDYAVTGSGTDVADAADFGGTLPSGTVTIDAAASSKTLTINVSKDLAVEPNEGFTVTLSNPTNGFVLSTLAGSSTITNDDSSTALASNLNPSTVGNSVTFTATVSSGSIVPTGTVQFFDGATSLGTVPLTAGSAQLITTALAPGTHSITAVYGGDANLGGSTSTAVSQYAGTVNPTHQQIGTVGTYTQQTGLYRVTVNVTNTTAFAINGFRLHVNFGAYTAAHPSLRLYNATNAPGANPAYVDHVYPVAVGNTVPVQLLFYTNNRQFPNPFLPILSVQTLTEPNNGAGPAGPGVPVTNIRELGDGTKLLEWDTIAGRWYRIRFSTDLTNWFICPVPIQAASNRQQWIDSGAPFTPISSADPSVTSRFYRVEEITLD